jgi:hypothetical protein
MVSHAELMIIPILGTLFSTPSESIAYLRGINAEIRKNTVAHTFTAFYSWDPFSAWKAPFCLYPDGISALS